MIMLIIDWIYLALVVVDYCLICFSKPDLMDVSSSNQMFFLNVSVLVSSDTICLGM